MGPDVNAFDIKCPPGTVVTRISGSTDGSFLTGLGPIECSDGSQQGPIGGQRGTLIALEPSPRGYGSAEIGISYSGQEVTMLAVANGQIGNLWYMHQHVIPTMHCPDGMLLVGFHGTFYYGLVVGSLGIHCRAG